MPVSDSSYSCVTRRGRPEIDCSSGQAYLAEFFGSPFGSVETLLEQSAAPPRQIRSRRRNRVISNDGRGENRTDRSNRPYTGIELTPSGQLAVVQG